MCQHMITLESFNTVTGLSVEMVWVYVLIPSILFPLTPDKRVSEKGGMRKTWVGKGEDDIILTILSLGLVPV